MNDPDRTTVVTADELLALVPDEHTALTLMGKLSLRYDWQNVTLSREDIALYEVNGDSEEWSSEPITDEEFQAVLDNTEWSTLADEMDTAVCDRLPRVHRRSDGSFWVESL